MRVSMIPIRSISSYVSSLFKKSRNAKRVARCHSELERLEDRLLLTYDIGFVADLDRRFDSTGSRPQDLLEINGTIYFTASTPHSGRELWKTDGTLAGTVLVKDIAPGVADSGIISMTNVGGTLFFAANDGIHGLELWSSDGTDGGTQLVVDINGQSGGSIPQNVSSFSAIGDTLYFRADDGIHGSEVWRSDGTAYGTWQVADIISGSSSAYPIFLTTVGDTLYFNANDGQNGSELWKSDGTEYGTVMVKDIAYGGLSADVRYFTEVNGLLYFRANDGIHGTELWKSDGTDAGTTMVKDILPELSLYGPADLTNVNGTLFFTADDGIHGTEIWKSDGTAAGTAMVKDINPSAGMSFAMSLFGIDSTLYFMASDGIHGHELWKSDGTESGTVMVKDIEPGDGASNPRYLVNAAGTLLFTAYSREKGVELWKSDGTATGTEVVQNIRFGPVGSSPRFLTSSQGTVYFVADDGIHGEELWKSSGTSGSTELVRDLTGGPAGNRLDYLTNVNGQLFFVADDGEHGYQLWKSDGTSFGTLQVSNLPIDSYFYGAYPTLVNGKLFFHVYNDQGGYQLWSSEGTPETTVWVHGLNSYPYSLTGANGVLYFTQYDPDLGRELWKSDGTNSGTVVVKDIAEGPYSGNPDDLTVLNQTLFFLANNGQWRDGLWKTDGTEAGTIPIMEFDNYSDYTTLDKLTNVGGVLYFYRKDPYYDTMELWKSDGTTSGTTFVKQFDATFGTFYFGKPVDVAGIAYFTAYDDFGGVELWKSDGTESGTVRVKDIAPGAGGSFPTNLTNLNGILYFTADDGESGTELWESDGTEFGTYLVRDINIGSGTSSPGNLTEANGVLFFTAFTTAEGFELWTSDGTFDGTALIRDLYVGPAGSHPRSLANVNGHLYFSAESAEYGSALWIVYQIPQPPEAVVLSTGTIVENEPIGTTVGIFNTIDPDDDSGFYYSLVDGEGSEDNGAFTIVGNELRTAVSLNYEAKNSYSIRLRSMDPSGFRIEVNFTISVTDVNEAPTNVVLSSASIDENRPSGTAVGTFSSSDPDSGNSFVYTLVNGPGSADNTSFSIVNGQLRTASTFDFESRSSYTIRVATTDQNGLSFERQFNITVTNINEAPTNIAISSASIAENQSIGTTVGILSSTDPDSNSFDYSLVTGPGSADNTSFSIVGGQLRTAAVFDFETKNSYSIRVRTADQGGLFFDKQLTINVTDIDETPVDITAPTVKIESSLGNPAPLVPIPITVTFNETVTGFADADLIVAGGTISGFTGTDRVFTFTVIPDGLNVVTVNIPENVAQDTAGNGNTAAVEFSRSIELIIPVTVTQMEGVIRIESGGNSDTILVRQTDTLLEVSSGDENWSFSVSGLTSLEVYTRGGADTINLSIDPQAVVSLPARIFSGEGNDTVFGGSGDDLLVGGPGEDTLHGQAGDDLLYGETDDDTLDGGTGVNSISAGMGVQLPVGYSSDIDLERNSYTDRSESELRYKFRDQYGFVVNLNQGIPVPDGEATFWTAIAAVQSALDGDNASTALSLNALLKYSWGNRDESGQLHPIRHPEVFWYNTNGTRIYQQPLSKDSIGAIISAGYYAYTASDSSPEVRQLGRDLIDKWFDYLVRNQWSTHADILHEELNNEPKPGKPKESIFSDIVNIVQNPVSGAFEESQVTYLGPESYLVLPHERYALKNVASRVGVATVPIDIGPGLIASVGQFVADYVVEQAAAGLDNLLASIDSKSKNFSIDITFQGQFITRVGGTFGISIPASLRESLVSSFESTIRDAVQSANLYSLQSGELIGVAVNNMLDSLPDILGKESWRSFLTGAIQQIVPWLDGTALGEAAMFMIVIDALKYEKISGPDKIHFAFWPVLMEFETRPEMVDILKPFVTDFNSFLKGNDNHNGLWAWLAEDNGQVDSLLAKFEQESLRLWPAGKDVNADYAWQRDDEFWSTDNEGDQVKQHSRLDYLVLNNLDGHDYPQGIIEPIGDILSHWADVLVDGGKALVNKLLAPLARLLPGTVDFKANQDGVTIDAKFKSPLIPAAFDVHGTFSRDGVLTLEGDAQLPLIGSAHLEGKVKSLTNYSFTGGLNGRSIGIAAFPSLAITLANSGLTVSGNSSLPVLGDVFLQGNIESDGKFALDVTLKSNWKLGGLSSNSFANVKAKLTNGGLTISGSVNLPAGLGSGTFNGTINSNGTYSIGVTLGAGWKLGGLNSSAFSNFKVTLTNNGISVSGSVGLPAGLGSGTFSGSINANGTFTLAIALGSSWKLGGLSKSSFSNFQATLSNNGIAVSGNVGLPAGLGSGSFSGNISTNGTFTFAVTLGSSWKLGGFARSAFTNFQAKLTNNGIGVSGSIGLPAGLGSGTFSGIVNANGTFAIAVTLGSSWKLGGLSKSSFSNFTATITNNGVGVSGTVSLPAGLGSGSFSGTVNANGTFSLAVSLGSSWKLGGLSKSAFSNFKATLSNNGISVSGTVALPGGLGSGSFSGTISSSGTFSFGVSLGSGRKLGGLGSSAFPTLTATLSNNGIGISGKLSLGVVGGTFSGAIGSNGAFSVVISVGSTVKVGGATLNVTFRLSDSGLGFSGKLKLPYVNTSYLVNGSVNSSGRFSFNGISGNFSSSPGVNELVRLWKGVGAGFDNIASALWNGGAMYGKYPYDLAHALVAGGGATARDIVRALQNVNISFFSIAKALGGSGLGLTLKEIASALYKYTDATFVDVADALWNSGVSKYFRGGFNSKDLVFALSGAGAGYNSLLNGLKRALNWSNASAVRYLVQLGFGGGSGGGSGGYIGQTLDRWGVNGYLEESTVFFDANKNGVLDSNEPWTITKAAGAFSVPVPVEFDINKNGALDDSEGQWVVLGGLDSSTGLPAAITLIAPASWSVMTPLSTLISELSNKQSLTIPQATSKVLLAMGLPAVDLTNFDPFVQTLEGNSNGPRVFAAHAVLPDTIVQIAALFTSANGSPSGNDLTDVIVDVLATRVASSTSAIDFGDAQVIQTLIQSVAARLGKVLTTDLITGAATVIAATNRQVTTVPAGNDLAFLEQIARIKHVAQAEVAQDLRRAALGQVTIASVIAENTGAALAAQIAAAHAPPILATPSPLVVEATGTNGAQVDFSVAAHDITGHAATVTYSHLPGSTFAIGVTVVTATATDLLGNTASTTFSVTVFDTTPPDLEIPDLVVEATTPAGALVTLPAAMAIDLVDPRPVIAFDRSSGLFSLGQTLVTATATDTFGNQSTVQFLITVVDSTGPALTPPPPIIVEATGPGGAFVTLPAVTATDLVDPHPEISQDRSSGVFELGTTVVSITAIDTAGNISATTYTVTVRDTTAPVLTVPESLVLEANTRGGFLTDALEVTASDLGDSSPAITFSTQLLAFGTTLVTATATDASGNRSSASFLVTVVDPTPPTVLPTDLKIEANAPGGALVTLPGLMATDLADPQPVVTFDTPSGFFPLGITEVAGTAMDASGNSTHFTFLVTVVDTTAPQITAIGNLIVRKTDADGAVVPVPQVVATDAADMNPQVTFDFASDAFPVGTTLVTATVTDASGNRARSTYAVTVIDSDAGIAVVPGITNTGNARVEGSPLTVTGQAVRADTLEFDAAATFNWSAYKGNSQTPFATATGINRTQFTLTPDDSGEIRVVLSVTDQQGGSATTETTLLIENVGPQVDVAYTVSGTPNAATVQLSGLIEDPSPIDESATFTYDWRITRNGQTFATATNQTGQYSFTIIPGGAYSVNLIVTDKDGGVSVFEQVLSTSAPLAIAGTIETSEDESIDGYLSATDGDGDPLTYSLVGGPSHGSVSVGPDGAYRYTPEIDFFGIDQFTFKVNDGRGDSNTGTMFITIASVNDAPQATDGHFDTAENTSLSRSLSATDREGGALVYSLVDATSNGSVVVNSNGSFVYHPAAGYHGEDRFTFQVSDGEDLSTAIVTISVESQNDAPVSENDSAEGEEDASLHGNLSATDLDLDPLTFSLVAGPSNGTVTIEANTGSYIYSPRANFSGVDTFTFRSGDGTTQGNLSTVSIAVAAVNDAPLAQDLSISAMEDLPQNGNLRGTDVDSSVLTYNVVTEPEHGVLTFNAATGAFSYTPARNFWGSDSFTYKVSDGALSSDMATVHITVAPSGNTPPVITSTEGNAVYQINSAPIVVDSGITVIDSDSNDLSGGNLTVSFASGGTASDRLAIQNQGPGVGSISLSESNVLFGGTVIGTWAGGTNGSTPLVITFTSPLATPVAVQSLARSIIFSTGSSNPATGNRVIQFSLSDGSDVSDPVALKPIRISAGANVAPVLTTSAGTTSYAVPQSVIVVDAEIQLTDEDSADMNGGVLTINIQSGISSTSVLAIRNEGTGVGQINLDGNNVLRGSTVIGNYSGGFTTNDPLIVTLNSNATVAAVQALARNVTFQVKSSLPLATDRIIRFVLTDGDGGTSAAVTKTIVITTPANHLPEVTMTGPTATYSKFGAPVQIDTQTVVTDPDTDAGKLGGGTLIISINLVKTGKVERDNFDLSSLTSVSATTATEVINGRRVTTIKLSDTATAQSLQAALRQIKFSTSKAGHKFPTRSIKLELKDSAGSSSGVVNKTVNVSRKRIR